MDGLNSWLPFLGRIDIILLLTANYQPHCSKTLYLLKARTKLKGWTSFYLIFFLSPLLLHLSLIMDSKSGLARI